MLNFLLPLTLDFDVTLNSNFRIQTGESSKLTVYDSLRVCGHPGIQKVGSLKMSVQKLGEERTIVNARKFRSEIYVFFPQRTIVDIFCLYTECIVFNKCSVSLFT